MPWYLYLVFHHIAAQSILENRKIAIVDTCCRDGLKKARHGPACDDVMSNDDVRYLFTMFELASTLNP